MAFWLFSERQRPFSLPALRQPLTFWNVLTYMPRHKVCLTFKEKIQNNKTIQFYSRDILNKLGMNLWIEWIQIPIFIFPKTFKIHSHNLQLHLLEWYVGNLNNVNWNQNHRTLKLNFLLAPNFSYLEKEDLGLFCKLCIDFLV